VTLGRRCRGFTRVSGHVDPYTAPDEEGRGRGPRRARSATAKTGSSETSSSVHAVSLDASPLMKAIVVVAPVATTLAPNFLQVCFVPPAPLLLTAVISVTPFTKTFTVLVVPKMPPHSQHFRHRR
jgi:hypothetical protein